MDREAAPGLIEFRGRAVTRLLELLPRLKKVALLLPRVDCRVPNYVCCVNHATKEDSLNATPAENDDSPQISVVLIPESGKL